MCCWAHRDIDLERFFFVSFHFISIIYFQFDLSGKRMKPRKLYSPPRDVIIILRSANFSKMWTDLTASQSVFSFSCRRHLTLNVIEFIQCAFMRPCHAVHSFPQHHHQHTQIHWLQKEDNERACKRERERGTSRRKIKISFFRFSCRLFFHVHLLLLLFCAVCLSGRFALAFVLSVCTKKDIFIFGAACAVYIISASRSVYFTCKY